ncbi:hypothetical protein GCM10022224_076050 [Nonomuraea antimicrobica]|uniref:Uncharacterized protein n=1 Tax=Nonomuraea antimicrobica TaxID=561173 RepID=A0ABP7D3L1_9ACTN
MGDRRRRPHRIGPGPHRPPCRRSGRAAGDRAQITASPLRATTEQLAGLPPALVITAEAAITQAITTLRHVLGTG